MIRSLMYLKGTPSLGLWYPKCSGFDIKGYSDSDYVGCNMDIKSTLGACQLLGGKLVPIFCNNTSAIAISNNLVLHSRTKHIDIRYHFIRDHILKGDIELHFIPTQYQLVDIFTKPLDEPTFKRLIVELDQVEFSFEEIALTTNNEVALLYPSHPKLDYFAVVSDFISKFYLKDAFIRAPTQYKEYLCEFWYTAKTLDDSKIWVSTPRAKSGPRRKQSSNHTSESKTEASKSKTGQSDKETQSSSTKDKSPSHPSPSTPVVGEMHKDAQQADGGPTSLGATNEEGAHPQLSSADSIAEADPGKSAPNDFIPSQQGMDEGTKNYSIDHIFAWANLSFLIDKTKSAGDGLKTAHIDLGTNEKSRSDEISKKINLENLSDLMKDTRSAFFTLDSSQNEPIIVSKEREEVETEKDKDTHATSHDVHKDTLVSHPPSPKSAQIQELMAQVHLLQSQKDKLEHQKAKAEAKVNALKAKPSYLDINQLTELLGMEIELPGDLNDIPTNWRPSLPLSPVLCPRFASIMENASQTATSKGVPSAGPATASPAEGEKNINPATKDDETTNLHNELVDLWGIDIVTQYYNKKLLYDKYCNKMLKRRKSFKIINCDVLTQKGPIILQVYREDGTIEVIPNFKVNDLHLAEWKEVVQACPDRKEN
ncbi:hypothetical protein Tco_1376187 [Tanacetum coccineum]